MTTYDAYRDTKPVSWIKAARKVFEAFPEAVRDRANTALTIAAEGGKAEIAKPLKGLGSSVLEIVVRYRTNAWRVVYVTGLDDQIWVLHAFQKKSLVGIKTPKPEIELIAGRLKRLKSELSP